MKPLFLLSAWCLLQPLCAGATQPQDSISAGIDGTLLKPGQEIPELNAADGVTVFPDADYPTSIAQPAYEKILKGGMPMGGVHEVNRAATAMPSMGFLPGLGMIGSWNGGALFSTGSIQHLTGLMGIESGSLNFRQKIGAFTFTLFGTAAKYGFYRGLSTTYGFGGSLTYDINERVGITVFGAYHSPSGINQASMMGYVDVPVFGGYINWRAGTHWGVKVGMQSYKSIAYGRWEAQPVVMPYYRTSGGAEIGIDVGGILYQVFRSSSGNGWGRPCNPTIGRPDFGPPPVAPRR